MIDRFIWVTLVLLFLLGLVSFWVSPIYEKGAWVVIGGLLNALSAALGAKFGLSTAKGQGDKQ